MYFRIHPTLVLHLGTAKIGDKKPHHIKLLMTVLERAINTGDINMVKRTLVVALAWHLRKYAEKVLSLIYGGKYHVELKENGRPVSSLVKGSTYDLNIFEKNI